MNRKGFVYIETMIAIVVLTTSLLFMYTTFSRLLQAEKTRVYYDDIAYIYKAEYIKKYLNDLNAKGILSDLNDNDNPFSVVGIESNRLFEGFEEEKNLFSDLLSDFGVSQIIIAKESKLNNLKECNESCAIDNTCPNYSICNYYYNLVGSEFINYIRTVYIDINCTYVMLIEFNTCENNNCRNYYSWVGM